ncbi:Spc97 Spc98 family protein [Rutstroemia sp. NJR-2017a BVV2]|nr:Spc97 Spc98 family protein [Rutstroemia sp. NJR-2017a BVV2]
MQLGASELRKPVDKINISKVQSLLDLILHQPGADSDPFKDDLKVEMNPTSLLDSLTRVVNISGMEPEAERQLLSSWQAHNTSSHRTSDRKAQLLQRRTFVLRARMLAFVQQLIYFCTEEVIEPKWQLFMAKLGPDGPSTISTVDALMQDHVDFLDTCLKGSMLTNSKLLRRRTKLLQTCTHFASFTGRFSKGLERLDSDLAGGERPAQVQAQEDKTHHGLEEDPEQGSSIDKLQKFELGFGRGLTGFMDALNHVAATETPEFLGLCARLSMLSQGAEFSGRG